MQPSILLAFFASTALFAHIDLIVHLEPQIPFYRDVPKPGRSEPVLHTWVMFTQVRDLMLALAGHLQILVSHSPAYPNLPAGWLPLPKCSLSHSVWYRWEAWYT